MPITKDDVAAIRASEKRHNDLLNSISTKMSEPSIALITNEDGSHSSYVKSRGRFVEVANVTVIDLRV